MPLLIVHAENDRDISHSLSQTLFDAFSPRIDRTGRSQSVRGGLATLESVLQKVYRIIWWKCSRWVHRVRNSIPFISLFLAVTCNIGLCAVTGTS